MIVTSAVFILWLVPPQDDLSREVQDLVQRLDDDSVEVREGAEKKISSLAKEALPFLEGAGKTASVEARERLRRAIAGIRQREDLLARCRPPSLITLDAVDRPLREVFGGIARQSSTPLDFSKVPAGEKVTVRLDKVPFWKAMDEVCRTHGQVSFFDEGDGLVLKKWKYLQRPLGFSGPMAVFREGLGRRNGVQVVTLGFRVRWEKGSCPDAVGFQLFEVRDGRESLLKSSSDRKTDSGEPFDRCFNRSQGFRDLFVFVDEVPVQDPPPLTRFKVVVLAHFILEYSSVAFENPEAMGGFKGKSGGIDILGGRCGREGENVQLAYLLGAHELAPGVMSVLEIRARDEKGVEFPLMTLDCRGGAGNPDPMAASHDVRLPNGFQGRIRELSFRVPKRVHEVRMEVDVKDCPLTFP